MKKVGIVLGSQSDLEKMQGARDALERFGIEYEFTVASAHRTPQRVHDWTTGARDRGLRVIIAGAGMAAHLGGVVASLTTLPVIGVPLSGSALNGVDALYSTVAMPRGTPVATVAIDGSFNAGILAVQILATSDDSLADALKKYKQEMAEKIATQAAQFEV